MFHRYPAMMHTQMLDYLMERLRIGKGLLLDPFCGTGRSLVAGLSRGCRVVGVDVNPLACIITRAKLTRLDPDRLRRTHERILSSGSRKCALPLDDPLLRFWFSERVARDLGALLHRLMLLLPKTGPTKTFFYTALSETVRDVSHTRKGEYKLYRMTLRDRRRHRPDVLAIFNAVVRRNVAAIKEAGAFLATLASASVRVYCDEWLTCDPQVVTPGPVDFVVTSPPYGDSRTTVAYGEFSRLSMLILSYDALFASSHGLSRPCIMTVDSRCLGGSRSPAVQTALPPAAQEIAASVAREDPERSRSLLRFLRGYVASLAKASRVIRPGGKMLLILGNRCVAGRRVRLDEITKTAASKLGLDLLFASRRDVPYKRLPRLVISRDDAPPTATMAREYVLAFEKR